MTPEARAAQRQYRRRIGDSVRGDMEDPRDAPHAWAPIRRAGPSGPITYTPFFLYAIAEIYDRRGWPGYASHLAAPPSQCGLRVNRKPGADDQ